MAKALYGHVGKYDLVMATEVTRLRRRVGELEAALLRLRAENDRLSAAADDSTPLTVGSIVDREPALT